MKREENENEMKEWIVNEIGDEGAKTISESLKINTSLTSLDLSCDEKIWNEKRVERDNEKIVQITESVKKPKNFWEFEGNNTVPSSKPFFNHHQKHGHVHERTHTNMNKSKRGECNE